MIIRRLFTVIINSSADPFTNRTEYLRYHHYPMASSISLSCRVHVRLCNKCRSSPNSVCPLGWMPLGFCANICHREARYIDRIAKIVSQLPAWKEQRLPPPRVSQSEYDKVGLTGTLWSEIPPIISLIYTFSPTMGLGFRARSASASHLPIRHCLAVSASYLG